MTRVTPKSFAIKSLKKRIIQGSLNRGTNCHEEGKTTKITSTHFLQLRLQVAVKKRREFWRLWVHRSVTQFILSSSSNNRIVISTKFPIDILEGISANKIECYQLNLKFRVHLFKLFSRFLIKSHIRFKWSKRVSSSLHDSKNNFVVTFIHDVQLLEGNKCMKPYTDGTKNLSF